MMTLTVEQLAAAGYRRYEVSNFARSRALRSRHNQKYWTAAPYLGLGPSAHSWMAPERYWNKKDVAAYIGDLNAGRPPIDGRERLDRGQMITEAIFLGLRTTDGIDRQTFADRFGVSLEQLFGGLIEQLAAKGLLTDTNDGIALTDKGILLLDAIAAEFVERL
jgi:oxygen-independent coproporphyrinogen-3 oxidase